MAGKNSDRPYFRESLLINFFRALELEQVMKDPSVSDTRKEQKVNQMRRAEAQYLRFLRTKEKAENFTTIKIIGKGAFGEVKLVQRKNDGKIYALKSLLKSEMVEVLQSFKIPTVLTYLIVQERPACTCSVRTRYPGRIR
jgi:serine/threonine protein kinase